MNRTQARMAAHAAFDPLWKSGRMTRNEAYKWLSRKMRLKPINCHMAMFDKSQCAAVRYHVACKLDSWRVTAETLQEEAAANAFKAKRFTGRE